MTILIEINNGQPIPLMWYIFILLFFRILALENIAKILTTGPRLVSNHLAEEESWLLCYVALGWSVVGDWFIHSSSSVS